MTTQQTKSTLAPNFIAQQLWASPVVYFLLSFITGGLYFYYFQYKLNTLLKKMNIEGELDKLHNFFNYSMIVRLVWIVAVFIAAFISDGNITPLLRLILIPAMIFEVLWSFKARNILSFYFADQYKALVNTNGVFLFFMPGLALTMMVNSVEREVELLKVLRDDK